MQGCSTDAFCFYKQHIMCMTDFHCFVWPGEDTPIIDIMSMAAGQSSPPLRSERRARGQAVLDDHKHASVDQKKGSSSGKQRKNKASSSHQRERSPVSGLSKERKHDGKPYRSERADKHRDDDY